MTEFLSAFENASALQWVLVGALVLAVWFLPVALALIFNRRQAKLIAIACVPAGFSLIAWSAVLLWSVTGKAVEKYLPEKVRLKLEPQ
ncbi:MAG: superinfection immunity protein [Pseudomonadota bacterium]